MKSFGFVLRLQSVVMLFGSKVKTVDFLGVLFEFVPEWRMPPLRAVMSKMSVRPEVC